MMCRYLITATIFCCAVFSFSQNDVDALRYSRYGIGGSSRFTAMGGAFGAVGADLSCAGFNPAGLGLFRRGEVAFSGGLRLTRNEASIYKTNTSVADVKFAFNNFGIAYAWESRYDPDSRHVIAFNNAQVLNFSNSTTMSGYTNNSSILKDMKNLADEQRNIFTLNNSYEGLAYDTYLLDDDTNGKFNSLVDLKRSVLQSRDLVTSGRVNELNFSYAYSYKDKFYLGASVGVPRVEFTSTTTHYESDTKDSMRVSFSDSSTYTTTYIDGLPNLHSDYINKLGFHDLEYTEYFKTQGSGLNLKLGGLVRVTDAVRLGMYFHTPTVYFLNDVYYNSMSASFDKNPGSPINSKYPQDGGYFEYRVITPSRLSFNSAFIIKKMAVIGIDYELVNYGNARFLPNKSTSFSDANSAIKNKYKAGHNLRLGAEVNLKPVMVRAGYAMQGSPFGDVFSGNFVRHNFSLGLGFRGKGKWYFDVHWVKSISTEDYFLFTTLNTKAQIKYSAASLGATVGIKF